MHVHSLPARCVLRVLLEIKIVIIMNYVKYNYSTEKEKSQTLRDGSTSLSLELLTTVSSRVSDSCRQRRDERLSDKATGVEVVTVVRVDVVKELGVEVVEEIG